MKSFKFAILSVFVISACNPDKKVDSNTVNKYIESSKIKKISQGEIVEAAEIKGTIITDSIQKDISGKLNESLLKGGIKEAIPFCILASNPIKNALEKKYNATISRTSFPVTLRNPQNAPVDIQKDILDAYSYNLENGVPLVKDVQIQEKTIVYNAPILITEKQCLRCHGEIGKDLSKAEYESILAGYPKDKSINLKMNEFIGLWTVKFSKKDFIQGIK